MIEKLKNHLKTENNNVIVVALPNKDLIDSFHKEITKNHRSIAKFIVKYISGKPEINRLLRNHNNKKEEQLVPKVIITTHAYLKNRGHSNSSYPMMLDLYYLKTVQQVTLHLFVNEGHLFLDSLP